MNQCIEDLKAIKSLIDSPEKWITGNYAKTSLDYACSPYNRMAVKFCLDGAAKRAVLVTENGENRYKDVILALAKSIDYDCPDDFEITIDCIVDGNDANNHAWVMSIIDTAIQNNGFKDL